MAWDRGGAANTPAHRVLVGHGRLLDVQVEREMEGLRFDRLVRLRERIKAVRDVALAGATVLLLFAAGWLVWGASHARGLVVEPFSVPPDLATRGVTDRVLATRLLDYLTAIDQRARGLRATRSFESGGEARVQLPESGLWLAEAHRWLRRTLGEETVVTGEVVRVSNGVVVGARIAGRPADTFSGPERELGTLLGRSAEALYARIQPFQFAYYLHSTGRHREALAIAERLAQAGPDEERSWAYVLVSLILSRAGDETGALRAARAAVTLHPAQALAQFRLATSEQRLGHDEAMLRHMRAAHRLAEDGLPELAAENEPRMQLTIRRLLDAATGDFGAAADELRDDPASDAVTLRADYLARNHDPSGAAALLERARFRSDAERLRYVPGGDIMFPDYHRAVALDRWPEALVSMQATDAAAAAAPPQLAAEMDAVRFRFVRPRLAAALTRVGRLDDAQDIIGGTPLDCVSCLQTRGTVAAAKGDAIGADRWFHRAVAAAPSSPFAYAEWGEARLIRGDLDGAIELFRRAQTRAPGWADPPKLEGDALARLGRHRAALGRYREAAKRAPRWGAIHLARGFSLFALQRPEEARAAFVQALKLDLSEDDRASVRALLGRIGSPPRVSEATGNGSRLLASLFSGEGVWSSPAPFGRAAFTSPTRHSRPASA